MHFPIYVELADKKITVIGGGTVALRRVETLLPFGCAVHVIAKKACHKLVQRAERGELTLCARAYREGDCAGADYVLAATDCAEINAAVAAEARKLGIPVNTSDCKENCDFYFPAVIQTDELVIGITSDGKDHTLVRDTAAHLRKLLHRKSERERDDHES